VDGPCTPVLLPGSSHVVSRSAAPRSPDPLPALSLRDSELRVMGSPLKVTVTGFILSPSTVLLFDLGVMMQFHGAGCATLGRGRQKCCRRH
jgi:hypothetical protein